jgi:DNA-binding NtrC family response regulator
MSQYDACATLLVVDDEPPLLRLLTRVLEKRGYTVISAANGTDAVALFDEHADVIQGLVLDVMVPPRGIGEVLDHIAKQRTDLALIVSSGDQPSPEIAEQMKSYGGVYLRKPFLPKNLLDLVESRLNAIATVPESGA